jgi:hypothetical protein
VEQLGYRWADFHKTSNMVVLLKYVENIQFSYNGTKIRGTLHEYVSTFMTTSVTSVTMVAVGSDR